MLIMLFSGVPNVTPHYAGHHSVCAVDVNTLYSMQYCANAKM